MVTRIIECASASVMGCENQKSSKFIESKDSNIRGTRKSKQLSSIIMWMHCALRCLNKIFDLRYDLLIVAIMSEIRTFNFAATV